MGLELNGECAGCSSLEKGEGSWGPPPGIRILRRAQLADPVPPSPQGRADAMALGEGEEGAGNVAGTGVAQEKEAPAQNCRS